VSARGAIECVAATELVEALQADGAIMEGVKIGRHTSVKIRQFLDYSESLQSKWIEAIERKPKERGEYLVIQGEWDNLPKIMNFGTSQGWSNGRYNHRAGIYRVTHWMPLPKPPKKHKGAE